MLIKHALLVDVSLTQINSVEEHTLATLRSGDNSGGMVPLDEFQIDHDKRAKQFRVMS